MQYARLFADERGDSHVAMVHFELMAANFALPAPPLLVSEPFDAVRFVFLAAPKGWSGDWHPAPCRQIFSFLSGEIEVEVSDGETQRFVPGDALLMEDTTGKGHATRNIGEADVFMAVTRLPA
jgi:quercetin dioxygenase-like cupin family protein